jgi:hypothetical protein
MNLTSVSFAEICKQGAFISAVVAGFSFAFIGALLINPVKRKIIDWVMIFSIISIAGLLICALTWTLIASQLMAYNTESLAQVPQVLLSLHRILSFIFILSFLCFLITLGLCGWIRSMLLGIFSSIISSVSTIFFFSIMKHFIH